MLENRRELPPISTMSIIPCPVMTSQITSRELEAGLNDLLRRLSNNEAGTARGAVLIKSIPSSKYEAPGNPPGSPHPLN